MDSQFFETLSVIVLELILVICGARARPPKIGSGRSQSHHKTPHNLGNVLVALDFGKPPWDSHHPSGHQTIEQQFNFNFNLCT
jgi:hypothetical protein